jgi:hypothetical protein
MKEYIVYSQVDVGHGIEPSKPSSMLYLNNGKVSSRRSLANAIFTCSRYWLSDAIRCSRHVNRYFIREAK